METKLLRNGTEEPVAAVNVLRLVLGTMLNGSLGVNGLLAVCEIGRLAKDPLHRIFSQPQLDLLLHLSLVEQGSTLERACMHDSLRNAVDALIEFVGEEPTLVDPYTTAVTVVCLTCTWKGAESELVKKMHCDLCPSCRRVIRNTSQQLVLPVEIVDRKKS